MISVSLKRGWVMGLLLAALALAPSAWAQTEMTRKAKSKVAPEYPQLARRMNITGVVKLQVTVAANGSIKNAKVVGGHPILVNSAMDAIKKWRYEPANEETTGIVEFRFDPSEQ